MSGFDPITQERVYQAIKSDYLGGLFGFGRRIDLHALADRHRASATPVREAVHRMVGEKLLEPHQNGGFRITTFHADALPDLYRWNAQQLLAVLHLVPTNRLTRTIERIEMRGEAIPSRDVANVASAMFLAIAEATSNREVVARITNANERFNYLRIAEGIVLGDLEREARALGKMISTNMRPTIRRRLLCYYDRRIGHAVAIGQISSGNLYIAGSHAYNIIE